MHRPPLGPGQYIKKNIKIKQSQIERHWKNKRRKVTMVNYAIQTIPTNKTRACNARGNTSIYIYIYREREI